MPRPKRSTWLRLAKRSTARWRLARATLCITTTAGVWPMAWSLTAGEAYQRLCSLQHKHRHRSWLHVYVTIACKLSARSELRVCWRSEMTGSEIRWSTECIKFYQSHSFSLTHCWVLAASVQWSMQRSVVTSQSWLGPSSQWSICTRSDLQKFPIDCKCISEFPIGPQTLWVKVDRHSDWNLTRVPMPRSLREVELKHQSIQQ